MQDIVIKRLVEETYTAEISSTVSACAEIKRKLIMLLAMLVINAPTICRIQFVKAEACPESCMGTAAIDVLVVSRFINPMPKLRMHINSKIIAMGGIIVRFRNMEEPIMINSTPTSAKVFSHFLVSTLVAKGMAAAITKEPGSRIALVSSADNCKPFCKNNGITKVIIYKAIIFIQSTSKAAT